MQRLNAALTMCLAFFFTLCGLVQGADLPARWDWRDHNGVTAVKDQGSCGSCWAFASVATVESAILINEGSVVNVSEQHLVSCNGSGWDCGGGWIAFDYYQWLTDQCGHIGTVSESCYPYTSGGGTTGSCTQCACSRIHEILNWGFVPGASSSSAPSDEGLKTYIKDRGPVFAALDTHTWCLLNPGNGVSGSCSGDNGDCNHGILIVGWDDDFKGSGNGCWIIKNSWGGWWQDAGFGYVKYATGSVGTAASWVTYYGSGGLQCENAIELTLYNPYDGTTQGAMSRVDAYGCDGCTSWNESGPEVVHQITTTSDGHLTVTLSDLNGVDLDVFILDACDPDSGCMACGDITTTYEDAPAGTYFIVVDGKYGASGSYTITAGGALWAAGNSLPFVNFLLLK